MEFKLNNFKVQTIGKDVAVSFEIENDDLSIQYSEVLSFNKEVDSKLYSALEAYIFAKVEKKNG